MLPELDNRVRFSGVAKEVFIKKQALAYQAPPKATSRVAPTFDCGFTNDRRVNHYLSFRVVDIIILV